MVLGVSYKFQHTCTCSTFTICQLLGSSREFNVNLLVVHDFSWERVQFRRNVSRIPVPGICCYRLEGTHL